MCTALTLVSQDHYHFFGRNMDLEYTFNQSVVLVSRHFEWKNVISGETLTTTHAILGMASVMEGHPLFADAFNEKGLACAGLNFPYYCSYDESPSEDQTNLGPYDLILWILSQFETVDQVTSALENICIVGHQFASYAPLPTLHWIVYDTHDHCIVIEKTAEHFTIYDNAVGVLTNSPTFDWHLTNLSHYIGLCSKQPTPVSWYKQPLQPVGQGLGLMGLPGDFYPSSRFVRAAYLKSHAAFLETQESTLSEFFHILSNVAMFGGTVTTPEDKEDLTLYASCMCLETGTYYYHTYNNAQISAITMHKEDLEAPVLKVFDYLDKQSIHHQN